MVKPIIRLIPRFGEDGYWCPEANRIYGQNVTRISGIFRVLKIAYMLEKDDRGRYRNRDFIKPIFEDGPRDKFKG